MVLEKVVLGLTGNIASGKSTVSKLMESYGAYVIDADKIGHSVYKTNSDLCKEIVRVFGPTVSDGTGINRKELGSRVFYDSCKMNILTNMVWPHIKQAVDEELNKASGIIVLEAAMLFEAGWRKNLDITAVVIAYNNLRMKRLIERELKSKGYLMTELDAKKRLAAQMSQEEKIRMADYLIFNNEGIEELEKETKKLWGYLSRIYSPKFQ